MSATIPNIKLEAQEYQTGSQPNASHNVYIEDGHMYSDTDENILEEEVAEDSDGEEEEEEYYVEQLPETIAESVVENGIRLVQMQSAAESSRMAGSASTDEPPKKRRRRRTVPPEVKKDNHKERERARRNLIKDRFAYLRATIPTLGDNAHKMARTEVLEHVIEYIQFMRNRNQNHMIDIENLRVNNVNMEEQTKGLHMALRYGYKLGGYTEPNTGEVIIDGVLPGCSVVETMPGNAFNVESTQSLLENGPMSVGVTETGAEYYHHHQTYGTNPHSVAITQQYESYATPQYGEPSVIMSGTIPASEAHLVAQSPVMTNMLTETRAPNPKTSKNFSSSSQKIVIPTTAPNNNDGMQIAAGPMSHCNGSQDAGFGYESPEEEFIMLSELKADEQPESKNGKRKERAKISRKKSSVIKSSIEAVVRSVSGDASGSSVYNGVSSNDEGEYQKPRGRGRPRKLKGEQSSLSLASVAAIEKIIDSVVSIESGLPPKKKTVNRVQPEQN
ncbi:uncharacterized protein LOC134856518 [Symsagittifera roscoffensis]|uniref:uncharacterized protein LOC134856518 n=1 Tax=Symsagittifera roscoffensis TaxID=84072 RepID=UPI00307C98D2